MSNRNTIILHVATTNPELFLGEDFQERIEHLEINLNIPTLSKTHYEIIYNIIGGTVLEANGNDIIIEYWNEYTDFHNLGKNEDITYIRVEFPCKGDIGEWVNMAAQMDCVYEASQYMLGEEFLSYTYVNSFEEIYKECFFDLPVELKCFPDINIAYCNKPKNANADWMEVFTDTMNTIYGETEIFFGKAEFDRRVKELKEECGEDL